MRNDINDPRVGSHWIDFYIVISFVGCFGFWFGLVAHQIVGG